MIQIINEMIRLNLKPNFVFLAGKEHIQPIIFYLENDQYSNPIPQQYSLGCKIKWLKDNTIKKLVEGKQLRNPEALHKIPNSMPGWYKWWHLKKY